MLIETYSMEAGVYDKIIKVFLKVFIIRQTVSQNPQTSVKVGLISHWVSGKIADCRWTDILI